MLRKPCQDKVVDSLLEASMISPRPFGMDEDEPDIELPVLPKATGPIPQCPFCGEPMTFILSLIHI